MTLMGGPDANRLSDRNRAPGDNPRTPMGTETWSRGP